VYSSKSCVVCTLMQQAGSCPAHNTACAVTDSERHTEHAHNPFALPFAPRLTVGFMTHKKYLCGDTHHPCSLGRQTLQSRPPGRWLQPQSPSRHCRGSHHRPPRSRGSHPVTSTQSRVEHVAELSACRVHADKPCCIAFHTTDVEAKHSFCRSQPTVLHGKWVATVASRFTQVSA
jgi:hypothetical protein